MRNIAFPPYHKTILSILAFIVCFVVPPSTQAGDTSSDHNPILYGKRPVFLVANGSIHQAGSFDASECGTLLWVSDDIADLWLFRRIYLNEIITESAKPSPPYGLSTDPLLEPAPDPPSAFLIGPASDPIPDEPSVVAGLNPDHPTDDGHHRSPMFRSAKNSPRYVKLITRRLNQFLGPRTYLGIGPVIPLMDFE